MKIIIYGLNFRPEKIGIGRYNSELASWLIDQGHTVKVICAPPYYPSWTIQDGYSALTYSSECEGNFSITRCPIWVPKSPTGLKRVIHLISFAVSSWPILLWYSLFWKPDLIFTVEPPIFCLPITLLISKVFKRKLWLHIQDFELDAGFSLSLIPNIPLFKKTVFWFEHFLLKRLDMVSTITEEMMKILASKGVSEEKCVLFPNWVDTKAIAPNSDTNYFRNWLGLRSDQIVCLYSGNLGAKQGLEIIIDSAQCLAHQQNITFVIAGDGPMKDKLTERSKNLKNVTFLDLQPQEFFNGLMNFADIHLLPQSAEASDLFFPSKLKAMFASGRPVISTAFPGTQLAQVIAGKGIVSPPGDVELLSKAIMLLSKDRQLCQQLGNAARHYAINNWEKNVVLGNIEKQFLDLTMLGSHKLVHYAQNQGK